MQRVLITGASGLLGANLVLAARPDDDVVAVFNRHPIERRGVHCIGADLSEPGAAYALFDELRPDFVVHCAAATDVDACEMDPEWAGRLNRDMAGWVAEAAARIGARMVHISTDAVFDGTQTIHTENEVPSPVNVYGRTKLEGERAVLDAHPDAAVVRTNLFGWNAQAKLGLAEWFLERLGSGRSSPGFTDVTFSPILVGDLASWLWRVLDAGLSGLWHIGGRTCLSKYEFGVKLAQAFELDRDLVVEASVSDAGMKAERPKALCLDSSRIEAALGDVLPTVDQGLARFGSMASDGTRAEIRAMALMGAEEA
jgi:dTDP-4-dehydrorhamnose reductase